VLAVHPDLVVMYKGTNPRLKSHLTAAGVKVLDVPWANSLADIRKTTLMLGKALGAMPRARAMLAAMDAKLSAARARAPHPLVSALIYEPNGYTASDAVTNAIMQASGLTDAARTMPANRLGRIPVEAVLAAAPTLIILNAAREGGLALADAPLNNPALAALTGRSLIVRTSLRPLLCPGPWSADSAAQFTALARQAAHLAKPNTRH
jgi:iron complex transport system substrate-binding protein